MTTAASLEVSTEESRCGASDDALGSGSGSAAVAKANDDDAPRALVEGINKSGDKDKDTNFLAVPSVAFFGSWTEAVAWLGKRCGGTQL